MQTYLYIYILDARQFELFILTHMSLCMYIFMFEYVHTLLFDHSDIDNTDTLNKHEFEIHVCIYVYIPITLIKLFCGQFGLFC